MPLRHLPDHCFADTFLTAAFFDRDAQVVARDLLGKVIRHYHDSHGLWLAARIIETEAYYLSEKGSHASLGRTAKRAALFAAPGCIYMYYARGGDSLNFSTRGAGNAVLIKSGWPFMDTDVDTKPARGRLFCGLASLAAMQKLNPDAHGQPRPMERLCAGQTLLCKSLGIKVPHYDGKYLGDPKTSPQTAQRLLLQDTGYRPAALIQTTRLGIPPGRDEHLPYRFVDAAYARWCTRNPLRRGQVQGRDYWLV